MSPGESRGGRNQSTSPQVPWVKWSVSRAGLCQVEQRLLPHNASFPFPCLSELAEVLWLSASLWLPGTGVALREGLTVRCLHYAAVLRDPSHRGVGSDNNRVRFAQGIVPLKLLDLRLGSHLSWPHVYTMPILPSSPLLFSVIREATPHSALSYVSWDVLCHKRAVWQAT